MAGNEDHETTIGQLVNKAVKATERIYNALKTLGKLATEEHIGALFDMWRQSFENNED